MFGQRPVTSRVQRRLWLNDEIWRLGDDRGSSMKLYVGNLPFGTTDEQLRDLFSQKGQVTSASVVIDRETGRSRGFGFVEMADANEANNAIEGFNGYSLGGRALVVNEARPKEQKSFGGGGGGSRSRGGW